MPARRKILAILLLISMLVLGSCSHDDAEPMIVELKMLDIANNDVSKRYAPLLLERYQDMRYIYNHPVTPIRIYAATTFRDGALLLIGFSETDENPQLIYLDENAILGTEYWYPSVFNYTYLKGNTIYFGLMYPGYDNLKIYRDFTYAIEATFSNGETKYHSCAPLPYPGPNSMVSPNGAYPGGYIFINEGLAWLDGVAFYDGDGNIDVDTAGIEGFPYVSQLEHKLMEPIVAGVENTVKTLDLSPLTAETIFAPFRFSDGGEIHTYTHISLNTPDAHIGLNKYLDDENFNLHLVWMHGNALTDIEYRSLKANAELSYDVYDASYIDPLSSTYSLGKLIAQVENPDVYWLDLSQVDYSGHDIRDSFVLSDRVPDKEGIYCVYVLYDGWYNASVVQVVS